MFSEVYLLVKMVLTKRSLLWSSTKLTCLLLIRFQVRQKQIKKFRKRYNILLPENKLGQQHHAGRVPRIKCPVSNTKKYRGNSNSHRVSEGLRNIDSDPSTPPAQGLPQAAVKATDMGQCFDIYETSTGTSQQRADPTMSAGLHVTASTSMQAEVTVVQPTGNPNALDQAVDISICSCS